MSSYEDKPDFFDRMGWLLDNIEERRGEFLRISPERGGTIWGRLIVVHDQLEQIAVEIDREVRVARGEKIGPEVSLGFLTRDLFGADPVLSLVEVTAEVHEALDAKRVRKGERNEVWVETPSREYRLERNKRPHQEATYVVREIREREGA